MCGQSVNRFSKDVMTLLQQYSWPGNVRELENVVRRAVILSEGKKTLRLSEISDMLPDMITTPEKLSPAQEAIFKIAKGKRMFTIKDLRAIKLSERAIRKHLTLMVKMGVLKAEGTKKNRRYVLYTHLKID